MDKKLQSIEDFIIDETIKYTGAHEGLNSKDDIRRIKDHVLSRLATAYSLEKMRRALDKLRRSVDNENHLMRNTPTNNLMHVLHKHTHKNTWPRFIDRLSGFAKVKVKSLLIDWSKVMVENQDIYHV